MPIKPLTIDAIVVLPTSLVLFQITSTQVSHEVGAQEIQKET